MEELQWWQPEVIELIREVEDHTRQPYFEFANTRKLKDIVEKLHSISNGPAVATARELIKLIRDHLVKPDRREVTDSALFQHIIRDLRKSLGGGIELTDELFELCRVMWQGRHKPQRLKFLIRISFNQPSEATFEVVAPDPIQAFEMARSYLRGGRPLDVKYLDTRETDAVTFVGSSAALIKEM